MSRGTIHRSIRAEDELWLQVKAKAESQGRNVSDITRELWRAWLTSDTKEDTK